MDAPQHARPHATTMRSSFEPDTPVRADPTAMRHLHRERDYGIGYGNSSGYGRERHFTDGHADPLFRLG